ncbi:MAG: glutamate ligase domain-containing protein, partial [Hyphomonadaceae bacterium]
SLSAHASLRGVRCVFVTRAALGQILPPLPGAHQENNAALAAALAREMAQSPDAAIEAGIRAVRWPGRLETIAQDPTVVADVGHTPGAIAAALAGFQAMHPGPANALVCGASADKNAEELIARLAPAFGVIICTAARHKGRAPAEIAAIARAANPRARIEIASDVETALAIARRAARGRGAVYVAGGLFVAAEAMAAAQGRNPAALRFF